MSATDTVPAVLLFFAQDGKLTPHDTRTLPVMCSDVAEAVSLLRQRKPAMVLADDARAVWLEVKEQRE